MNKIENSCNKYSIVKKCLLIIVLMFTYSVQAQQDIFEVCRIGSLEDIKTVYKENPETINQKNENGYLPLTLACYHKNIEVVSFLVNKVKDINGNSDYGTPLMAATFKGSTEIVEILLNNNAITDLQDKKGETAAHYAVLFKKIEIIKLLVDAEADFEIKNNNEKSPIDYAKLYDDYNINELLKI